MLNPYQIAEKAQDKDGLANIRAINKLYREQDESHLWPISGRFNATDRAIRRARAFARDYGNIEGLEYSLLIDQLLSDIVNNTI